MEIDICRFLDLPTVGTAVTSRIEGISVNNQWILLRHRPVRNSEGDSALRPYLVVRPSVTEFANIPAVSSHEQRQ
jgi:hypothetical protein